MDVVSHTQWLTQIQLANYLSAPLSHITIHSFSLQALFDTKDLFTLMCTNANFVMGNCTQHTSLFPVHILKYAFLPFSSLFSPLGKCGHCGQCDPSTHLSGPHTVPLSQKYWSVALRDANVRWVFLLHVLVMWCDMQIPICTYKESCGYLQQRTCTIVAHRKTHFLNADTHAYA